MTWQPIDTAPKDGTPILGWDGEHIAICYWYQYKLQSLFRSRRVSGGWYLSTTGGMQEDSGSWLPTHWQPLPAPPTDPPQPR